MISLGLPIIPSARYYNHLLWKNETTEAHELTFLAQDTGLISRGSRIFLNPRLWFVMICYAHWHVAVRIHFQGNNCSCENQTRKLEVSVKVTTETGTWLFGNSHTAIKEKDVFRKICQRLLGIYLPNHFPIKIAGCCHSVWELRKKWQSGFQGHCLSVRCAACSSHLGTQAYMPSTLGGGKLSSKEKAGKPNSQGRSSICLPGCRFTEKMPSTCIPNTVVWLGCRRQSSLFGFCGGFVCIC